MTTIANLRVNFEGNTSSFDAATGRVNNGMRGIMVGAAGLISGAALGGVMRSAIDAGSAIYDMAQRTGLSAELLSTAKIGVEQMGASLSILAASSLKLNKAAQSGAEGSKKFAEIFTRLGLDVAQFAKLSADEKLRTVAEALSKVTDQGERNLLVTKLMGGGATKLNELWAGGAKALDAMRASGKAAFQEITTEQAAAADGAGDALDTLKASWTGLQNQFGLGFAPIVTRDIESLTRHLGTLVGVVDTFFTLLHGAGNILGATVAAAVQMFSGNFSGAGEILGGGGMLAAGRDLFRDPTKDGERAAEQRRTNELLQQQLGLNKEMVGVLTKNGRVVAQ